MPEIEVVVAEEPVLPFDPRCPRCGKHCGAGDEITDGGQHDCIECDALLVAVEYADEMLMHLVGARSAAKPPLTGRQRTRARWRRQGRR